MNLDVNLIFDLLSSGIRLSVPLIIVSLGLLYTERCGILNIGAEGMMLVGTYIAIAIMMVTGSTLLASIGAMAAGGLLSCVFAYLTINRRTPQIVTGFAINMFALGLTNVLAKGLLENRVRTALYPKLSIPFLQDIPIANIVANQPVIFWVAVVLVLVSQFVLYRTSWGLNIRAVGEYPKAVASAGLSVYAFRYAGVILGGVFAGLAGAALTLTDLGYFVPNMTAGRALFVLAALIVGKWDPLLTMGVCFFFGVVDATQLRFQTFGSVIPHQFLLMLPYILTIAALAGFVGRTVTPKAYSIPYVPEED